jgi:hypothetical protein
MREELREQLKSVHKAHAFTIEECRELRDIIDEMRKVGFLRKDIKPEEVRDHMMMIAKSWLEKPKTKSCNSDCHKCWGYGCPIEEDER